MGLSDSLRFLERPGCHLCVDAWQVLERLGLGDAERVDVEDDDELLTTYGLRIPVLLAGDEVVAEGHFDGRALRRTLRRRAKRT